MPFEKLHLPLVTLRGGHRIESAEIAALAGRWIYLPRIKAILARFEFANHKFFSATFSSAPPFALPLKVPRALLCELPF